MVKAAVFLKECDPADTQLFKRTPCLVSGPTTPCTLYLTHPSKSDRSATRKTGARTAGCPSRWSCSAAESSTAGPGRT